MNTVSITDYLQSLTDIIPAIQMGIVPSDIGIVYHKFAGSINISTTQSIISTCPNENPFNTDNLPLYISSTDNTDTQEIFIEGINQNYQVVNELITLQGQTAVSLQTDFRTIWRGYNNNTVDLAGDIYIGSESNPTNGEPAENNMYLHIPGTINGKLTNQSLTSIFTIPDGYTGFITSWFATATKGKDIDFIAYTRENMGIWRYQDRISVYESTFYKEMPYMRIPEKTDMKVLGATQSGTSNASTTYDMILINNEYLKKMRQLKWR